jgi:NodT family efflux transporter outer membrane factor (OMF) lipoprotein
MNRARPGGLVVAAALLAGCAAAPPQRDPAPAAPAAPAAWHAPLPHEGSSAELVRWWQSFDDPLVAELIEAAQAASPTLASALARIERSRAALAAAAVTLQVSAVGTASSGRTEPGTPTASRTGASLQAAWETDLFGERAAGERAARARLEGARSAWHDARVALAAEAASQLVALRACEAALALQRSDAASRAETARLTELRERSGFSAPADAELARAGAAQARAQAGAQAALCESQAKALVELTAIDEPRLRERLAAAQGRVPKAAALRIDAAPAALLAQRPDLHEASSNVVAAAGDEAQARARQRPQVQIAGSIGALRVHSGGLSAGGATWSFGPLQVSLPLFDGGVRQANVAAARAAYDEAVAAYQAALRRAVREVEQALVAIDSAAQRSGDAESAARGFDAALRATEARQRGGLASLFELEEARRLSLAARNVLVDLERERTLAWIRLYRALGGGWTAAGA